MNQSVIPSGFMALVSQLAFDELPPSQPAHNSLSKWLSFQPPSRMVVETPIPKKFEGVTATNGLELPACLFSSVGLINYMNRL